MHRYGYKQNLDIIFKKLSSSLENSIECSYLESRRDSKEYSPDAWAQALYQNHRFETIKLDLTRSRIKSENGYGVFKTKDDYCFYAFSFEYPISQGEDSLQGIISTYNEIHKDNKTSKELVHVERNALVFLRFSEKPINILGLNKNQLEDFERHLFGDINDNLQNVINDINERIQTLNQHLYYFSYLICNTDNKNHD